MTEKKKLKAPSINTLMRWEMQGKCKALCGCWVEPDGHCGIHDKPSWLLVLGLI